MARKPNATAAVLSLLLEQSGMTQAELASRVGVRRQAIQLALSGRQYVSATLLRDMLDVFNPPIRVRIILQWFEDQPKKKRRRR